MELTQKYCQSVPLHDGSATDTFDTIKSEGSIPVF